MSYARWGIILQYQPQRGLFLLYHMSFPLLTFYFLSISSHVEQSCHICIVTVCNQLYPHHIYWNKCRESQRLQFSWCTHDRLSLTLSTTCLPENALQHLHFLQRLKRTKLSETVRLPNTPLPPNAHLD